jgi:hypothetical protein
VEGVLRDAMHSKRRGPPVEWLQTAIALRSRFLRWGHWGPRTQERAARLIAQVVARLCGVPVWLNDGWQAYPAALLQVLGRGDQRRRRGRRARHPKPRLVPPRELFYGPVMREGKGKLLRVVRRVGSGGPRRFVRAMAHRGLGATLQTAFMERWDGTLRGLCAPRGDTPAAAPRVSVGTARGSGWWSTSPTVSCPIRACASTADRAPRPWPSGWPRGCGAPAMISGILSIPTPSAAT